MDVSEQRVVFFDLDGCLVDSTIPIQQALDGAFTEHGLPPVPEGGLPRYIGPPMRVSLTGLAVEHGRDIEIVDALLDGYRERYAKLSIDLAVAYPGIPELLARLAETERLAVCTSKTQHFAVPIIEALGLDVHFEVMVGPDLDETEPKTETLARALKLVAPCHVVDSVMIGDRRYDIEAAVAHGLAGVGVKWGFGSHDELTEAGAHAVVANTEELGGVLADLAEAR